jgi:hypothetical protein
MILWDTVHALKQRWKSFGEWTSRPGGMSDSMNRHGIYVSGLVSLLPVFLIMCAACTRQQQYVPPRATIALNIAPVQVEAEVLYSEWISNFGSALARYQNTEIYLHLLPVDELILSPAASDSYIRSGSLKLFAAVPSDLDKIKAGDGVDVVGRVRGMDGEDLLVSDCWIRVVDTRKPQGY